MSKMEESKKFMEDFMKTLKDLGIESNQSSSVDLIAELMADEVVTLRKGLVDVLKDTGRAHEIPSTIMLTTILIGAINITMLNGFRVSKVMAESIRDNELTAESTLDFINSILENDRDTYTKKIAKILHDSGKLTDL